MSPGLRTDRLERLLALAGEADARTVLLTRPEHVYYLVGIEPPGDRPVALLVSRDGLRAVWPDEAPADLPPEVDALGFREDFGPACARHLLPVAGAEPLVDAELAPLPFRSARDGRHVLEALVRR